MAILRARYLAELTQQRVLLVTFNKTLVTYLKALAADQQLPSLVRVENYHLFARGYLKSRGLMKYNDIVDSNLRQRLIKQAVDNMHSSIQGSQLQYMPTEFFAEESKWIAGSAIQNRTDYALLRQGAGGATWSESECEIILQIHQHYLQLRTQQGYRYDWDDIALTVEKVFVDDNMPRLYHHIVYR